eukprot:TRINITY_DN5465_c0_g2_i1.p1 TRINITY_DN5465_c0_g2~~TRINITY_DN5465_c0_g2_i1.p1  ORF type:complete len:439 (+),score=69.33 TRINITY_DN5465_c0_g2_i1:100-1416(+)
MAPESRTRAAEDGSERALLAPSSDRSENDSSSKKEDKPAQPAPAKKPQRANLPHLTGVRTLVAMMILIHHMSPRKPESSISILIMRVDVAVELFMMLSGFMTHYAYGGADTGSFGSLLAFYVRRLARVCVTTQVGMLICLFWWWFGSTPVLTASNAGCLLFLKPWMNPEPDCPDAPGWFIAATIPSWLLYPVVTRRILNGANSKIRIFILCFVTWLVAFGPQLVFLLLNNDWLTWQQVKLTWFWPPSQIADFALGAAVAALLKQVPPPKSAGVLADFCAFVLIAVCAFAPVAETPDDWAGPIFRPGHYMAWDGLSGRLAAPFLAAWIYCSSGGNSWSAKFCSHPLLVTAGAYTLEVYLFQTPLHDLFTWTKEVLWLPQESTEVFFMYVFLLWVLCVMFVDLLAAPADKWLRGATESWTGKPMSYFFSGRDSYEPVADL